MRKRFTLIELLVTISIMLILASLLFPALTKAKMIGKKTRCAGNLKQFGVIYNVYSNDFNDYMCPRYTESMTSVWSKILIDSGYIPKYPAEKVFSNSIQMCPDGKGNSYGETSSAYYATSYGINACVSSNYWASQGFCYHKRSQITRASTIIQSSDASNYWMGFYTGGCGFEYITNRHIGKCNILFVDGHTGSIDKNLIPNGAGISLTDFYTWWGPNRNLGY